MVHSNVKTHVRLIVSLLLEAARQQCTYNTDSAGWLYRHAFGGHEGHFRKILAISGAAQTLSQVIAYSITLP